MNAFPKTFLVHIGILALVTAEYTSSSDPYPAVNYPLAAAVPDGSRIGGTAGGSAVVVGTSGYGGFTPYVGGPVYGGVPSVVPPPAFGLSPLCTKLENVKAKLIQITEPLFVVGISISLFWLLKNLFGPQIGDFASDFKRRMDDEDMLDRISNDVARALSEGICTQKIACSLGISSRQIPGLKTLAKIIPKKRAKHVAFIDVWQTVAAGKQSNCEAYSCFTQLQ
ncbi:uncharacterized protein LOC106666595 [Cimex lectularius]|uniref:Uncharacterized protein n=1 Tax=Cimex lectularius TaxID=79782 RepID=A0A8I6RSR6_CIMLE|nr:uncharacterized protein LOC106666595 [Cimex lectularius]